MRGAVTPYLALAARSVRRFTRTPEMLVNTLGFPVLLLLTLLAVFSSAVEAFDDGSYAQRLVPALVVAGLMFGSIGTAVGLHTDLHGGFMERIRSMPVPAAAPMVGVVGGEVVRALAAVGVLAAAGHLFDFRFHRGLPGAVAFFAVAAVAGASLAWPGLALATRVRDHDALAPPLGALFLVLLFFSQGMVPLDAYPGWAQPIVRANPATAYVTVLDRLARGGEVAGPLLAAAGWSVAITAALGSIAVAGFRRTVPGVSTETDG